MKWAVSGVQGTNELDVPGSTTLRLRQLGETLRRVEGSLVASSSKKSRNFFNVPLYIIYCGGSHTILMQMMDYSILFYCVSLTVALCSQPGQSKLGWTGQVISIL